MHVTLAHTNQRAKKISDPNSLISHLNKSFRLKKKNWFQNLAVVETEDTAGFNLDDVTQLSAAITGCASNFINIITYIQKLSIMSNGTSLKHLFAADYSIITPVIHR